MRRFGLLVLVTLSHASCVHPRHSTALNTGLLLQLSPQSMSSLMETCISASLFPFSYGRMGQNKLYRLEAVPLHTPINSMPARLLTRQTDIGRSQQNMAKIVFTRAIMDSQAPADPGTRSSGAQTDGRAMSLRTIPPASVMPRLF